jgi:hypothetical protein
MVEEKFKLELTLPLVEMNKKPALWASKEVEGVGGNQPSRGERSATISCGWEMW